MNLDVVLSGVKQNLYLFIKNMLNNNNNSAPYENFFSTLIRN